MSVSLPRQRNACGHCRAQLVLVKRQILEADRVTLSRWFDILPDAKISRRAEDCRLSVISHFDPVNVPRLTSNEIPGPRAQAGYLSADQC
jgi:hypothetical protein